MADVEQDIRRHGGDQESTPLLHDNCETSDEETPKYSYGSIAGICIFFFHYEYLLSTALNLLFS